MSLVFAKEECTQALLDFLSYADVNRVSRVAEEAENSDHEESSDGVCVKVGVFWQFFFGGGSRLATLLLFPCVTREAGRKYVRYISWPLAAECNLITNKQTGHVAIVDGFSSE